MRARRVAVIGAGASGLAAAKWLAHEGLEATVFEATGAIGGIWRYDESLPGGGSPSYRSLVTNVSRQKTHLSDHELGADLADFPARAQVLAWLEAYAARFRLRPRIRLRTRVRAVEPVGASWRVDGEAFDAVVVASGLFSRPYTPPIPGLGSFRGRVIHASTYTHPDPFAGQDVLVAGAGSSGADIAVELARVAHVSLAVRSVAAVVPKTVDGRPLDHLLTRRIERLPGPERGRILQDAIAAEYRARGLADPGRWPRGLTPIVRGRAPTPSEGLAALVLGGTIALRPEIAKVEAADVVLADGTRPHADAVVLATGYTLELPFLAAGLLAVRDGTEVDLYRSVWHPDAEGLAFVGLCRVSGAVPPVAEMQARWIAAVLAGRAALPSPAERWREIARRREQHRSAGTEYMRVPFLGYLDEIAGLIGARPADEERLQDAVVSATQYR